jgi:hypothetical protein
MFEGLSKKDIVQSMLATVSMLIVSYFFLLAFLVIL